MPNRFAREWIEANCPDGVDGELMLRHGTFSETASAIGREDGQPDFVFFVFDYVGQILCQSYEQRMVGLFEVNLPDRCRKVLPILCNTIEQLEEFEALCIAQGYEGVMVRDPHGPYKCGRSTEKEGYLLKIKRFEDDEAVIVDFYEGMTNLNEATKDAFGHTKRSSAQGGKVGRGELGGFVVRDLVKAIEFRVGYNPLRGGISRADLWRARDNGNLVGRVITYRHQPSGAKDAPRFPQFVAFREKWDQDPLPDDPRATTTLFDETA